MIRGVALLVACQLAGETVAHLFPVPLPGPVIGLILLALGLVVAGPSADRTGVGPAADAVLSNLGLLFVPAGVGIVPLLPMIGGRPFAILAVIVVATTVTMIVTASVYVGVKRLTGSRP